MKDLLKKIIVKIITWQARYIIRKNSPKIIAITGNLGKTSTKDFVYSALKKNIDTNNTTNVQDITVQKLIKPIEIDTTFKQSNTQQAIMTKQDNIKTPEEKSFIVIFNK